MTLNTIVKWWKIYLGVVVLIAMVTRLAFTLNAPPSTTPRAQDRVKAARTSTAAGLADARVPAPAEGAVSGNAIVEPRDRETKVAAATSGRIAAIRVREGEQVRRGTVVVQLEDAPERAALQAAEADLATAQARLTMSVDAFQRVEEAAHGGAATADDLDKARDQAEVDRRSVEGADARRDQARATLERLAVRAPIDGEVLQVKYRAGEYVTPGGDPLIVMGDTRVLRVRVDVDERDIGRIAVGDPAYVVADAYPARRFEGSVVEIGRRMGRKNVRTDDPTERIDTKILETVIELTDAHGLVPGLRVTGYVVPRQ
jgi:HlyD family secretion protein